jgi:hypothetical protein
MQKDQFVVHFAGSEYEYDCAQDAEWWAGHFARKTPGTPIRITHAVPYATVLIPVEADPIISYAPKSPR